MIFSDGQEGVTQSAAETVERVMLRHGIIKHIRIRMSMMFLLSLAWALIWFIAVIGARRRAACGHILMPSLTWQRSRSDHGAVSRVFLGARNGLTC